MVGTFKGLMSTVRGSKIYAFGNHALFARISKSTFSGLKPVWTSTMFFHSANVQTIGFDYF